MKKIFPLLLPTIVFMAFTLQKNGYEPGDKASDFALKSTSGKTVSLASYKKAKGFIIVFTCNHCPYAKAYEDRIINLQSLYGDQYPVVAISSNDAKSYPEDDYSHMVERAKNKGFNFEYLYDDSQEVAKAYGAKKTPHVYVLSKSGSELVVEYVGAIDNNYDDAMAATKHYVRDAIDALKQGKKPEVTSTIAIGCSIKWKK